MYNGGTVPFGLMIDEEKCYYPDPKTSPIVLEIYEMYAKGMTMLEIVENLDERQIRGVHGNKIGLDTLTRILSNRKYIGEYKYRDIVIEDGIPAIVPKDLFDKVQELKAKNKKAPARSKAEEPYCWPPSCIADAAAVRWMESAATAARADGTPITSA
jgi:hypothetical protein